MSKQTDKKNKLDYLLNIGTMMSNACYNLKQSDKIDKRDQDNLNDMQTAWDKALSAYKLA